MSYHRSQGSMGNGIAGKIDEYFDKKELPMYKDKPYNYATSKRRNSRIPPRRVLALVVLAVILFLYFLGVIPADSITTPSSGTSTSSWGWFGRSGSSVDWEARRKAVKEAFILSWDGYEQYAWGK